MPFITTVLFDVGGVLCLGTAAQVRDRLASELDLSSECLHAMWRASHRALATGALTPEAFATGISEDLGIDEQRFLKAWRIAAAATFEPRANLVRLARDLQANYRVGILSNTNALHAAVNRAAGIYDGFNPILLSCEMACAKPDPDAYWRALTTVGESAPACLLIDDREANIEAAEAVGMRGIVFTGTGELRTRLLGHGLRIR